MENSPKASKRVHNDEHVLPHVRHQTALSFVSLRQVCSKSGAVANISQSELPGRATSAGRSRDTKLDTNYVHIVANGTER